MFALHRFSLLRRYFAHRNDTPKPREILRVLPKVTVQLPVYNEPKVVERLLKSVGDMAWPPELLQIQILDDSTDETSQIIDDFLESNANFQAQVIRREIRTGFKAGALKQGLETATGEYIVVFDSDFIPPRDFLHRVVSHFQDPKIDMVQVRWDHANRQDSMLTRAQALLLDGHFILEHTARNRSGCFFNFNGTAGVWRKKTIIEAGNWQGDTLTEDLDLSYRAQMQGSNFLYLPEYAVLAELPKHTSSFKSQQHRWTKGTAQVLRKLTIPLLRSKVPLKVKVEALAHFFSGVCYPLIFILGILLWPVAEYRYALGESWTGLNLFGPENQVFAEWFDIFFVPLGLLSFFAYYSVAALESKRVSHLKTPLEVTASLFLGIGLSLSNSLAFFEGMLFSGGEFKRTPKDGTNSDKNSAKKTSKVAFWAKGWRPWLKLMEGCLVIYFSIACVRLVIIEQYGALPFMMVFLLSNLWMFASELSLQDIFPKSTPQHRKQATSV